VIKTPIQQRSISRNGAWARGGRLPWCRFRRLLPWAIVPVLLLAVSVASGHSLLTRSEPEAGQILDRAPEKVIAWFGEELDAQLSSMRVVDNQGKQIDNGDGRVDLNDLDHRSMIATLPPDSPDGIYTVQWSAVSAEDGDASEGVFSFTAGQGAAAPDTAAQPAGGASWIAGAIIGVIALILLALVVIAVRAVRRQKTPVQV